MRNAYSNEYWESDAIGFYTRNFLILIRTALTIKSNENENCFIIVSIYFPYIDESMLKN